MKTIKPFQSRAAWLVGFIPKNENPANESYMFSGGKLADHESPIYTVRRDFVVYKTHNQRCRRYRLKSSAARRARQLANSRQHGLPGRQFFIVQDPGRAEDRIYIGRTP